MPAFYYVEPLFDDIRGTAINYSILALVTDLEDAGRSDDWRAQQDFMLITRALSILQSAEAEDLLHSFILGDEEKVVLKIPIPMSSGNWEIRPFEIMKRLYTGERLPVYEMRVKLIQSEFRSITFGYATVTTDDWLIFTYTFLKPKLELERKVNVSGKELVFGKNPTNYFTHKAITELWQKDPTKIENVQRIGG